MSFDSNDAAPVPQQSAMIEVQKSIEVQRVQGAIISAKKFPRDSNQAFARIMEACKRPSFAAVATFSYPRGNETVSGPSIRLAEVLVQNFGNMIAGVQELESQDGATIFRSYCWDLETNFTDEKIFRVPHTIRLKGGSMKPLTDPRDIYELVANMGARRKRGCILAVVPKDVSDAAVAKCRETLKRGTGEPIGDRIRNMVTLFNELGVNQEMVETRLGHKIDLTTADELVDLHGIYNAIRAKEAKRGDFFAFPEDEPSAAPEAQSPKAKNLTDLLKQKSAVKA